MEILLEEPMAGFSVKKHSKFNHFKKNAVNGE